MALGSNERADVVMGRKGPSKTPKAAPAKAGKTVRATTGSRSSGTSSRRASRGGY